MNESLWEELSETIEHRYDVGTVTTAIMSRRPGTSWRQAADEVVTSQSFSQLGERWIEIDSSMARNIVIVLLEKDLVYWDEVMDNQAAVQLADKFMSMTSTSRKCFTNGMWTENSAMTVFSWNGITKSTFDGGVVCVDDNLVTLFWVENED